MPRKQQRKDNQNLWPEDYRCAVALSFDFDAESDEMRTAPEKIVPMTKGRYGANVGLDRIFKVLEGLSLPATFFIPGWVAENYAEKIHEILSRGFEVAGHGYLHEKVSEVTSENETLVIQKCISGVRRATGSNPVGYRAPWFDLSARSLKLLSEFGFEYDSSLMSQDLPYLIKPEDSSSAKAPLVELPVDWCLDDFPAFEVNRKSPREVREIWRAEFDGQYSYNSFFNLTMHPDCIGRPARIEMLRDFLKYMQSKPKVWFATCYEVSKWWRAAHSDDFKVEQPKPQEQGVPLVR